ncbi:hypothetical protein H1R20_g15137, partial [Candolleomyces eurysporus]
MARTKRAPQTSAKVNDAPPASPEYVPDDYEVVEAPKASPVKKRSRKTLTPIPAGILTQAPAAIIACDSDDEDSRSITAISVTASSDSAGDGDVEDGDLETPKASKLMGKSKAAMNLKTQLGGTVGVNSIPDGNAVARLSSNIAILPSSDFTLENKSNWAGSARSSDDPLLARKSILDPYMVKHGHYNDLPKANALQLVSAYETRGQEFTDGALTSLVPGLSVSTWDCFGIGKAYVASLLRIPQQGQYINPSTVDVTELVFKETYSSQGPGTAYAACDKEKGRPVVFVTVGAIMESFLVHGMNIGPDGKPPFAKGVLLLGHRFEYERQSCTFATLWQAEEIQAPIQRRVVTFQTRNRPNNVSEKPDRSIPVDSGAGIKVGKLDITSYASPTKRYTPKNQTSIDFADEVPVYDGRGGCFNPSDVAGSLSSLPKFETDDGEVPEGSGVVVGYGAATSKFNSTWKLTFYIQWIVVLAV